LSDYFEAGQAHATDVVAFSAVTMGHEVSKRAREYFESNRYTDYLYLHGLGVEAAEGLAELFHKRLREEWGIGGDDSPIIQKLFKKHYRGCRYSFGYPACPSLEDQVKLFELLQPERIGLHLSEHFQLEPEQSTTALVVHHPAARYFNVTRSAGCDAA
jgi:5-methyltetrahydrofolate--homocysteine methyltransferase